MQNAVFASLPELLHQTSGNFSSKFKKIKKHITKLKLFSSKCCFGLLQCKCSFINPAKSFPKLFFTQSPKTVKKTLKFSNTNVFPQSVALDSRTAFSNKFFCSMDSSGHVDCCFDNRAENDSKNFRKVFAQTPENIVKHFLRNKTSKCSYGHVEYGYNNTTRKFLLKIKKSLRNYYFIKKVNKKLLWTRRMLFWQLCLKIFAK